MPLSPLPVVDTRPLFRPVAASLVTLLRGLPPDDWQRPTLAGTWVVRDVVAHLVDVSFRRLSFQRDRMVPPPPPFPIAGEADFVRFINGLNHDWVTASRRLSPRVLTDLFERAGLDLAAFFEESALDGEGLFGVSWAGEMSSAAWFDTAREFTELWHHQMQIRLAVGAPPLDDPRHLRAVLEVSLRVLPHVYRGVAASEGEALVVEIAGPAGGAWTLRRDAQAWTLWAGGADAPTTKATCSDDAAWRLFYNALRGEHASAAIAVVGRKDLAQPFLHARSIVI